MPKRRPESTRKLRVKYSKQLVMFICDRICEGYNLAEVLRTDWSKIIENAPDMPEYSTVGKWQLRHKECHEALLAARTVWLNHKLDELDEISREPMPKGLTALEQRAFSDDKRQRMDALKFILGKAGPVLNRKLERELTKKEIEDAAKKDAEDGQFKIITKSYKRDD